MKTLTLIAALLLSITLHSQQQSRMYWDKQPSTLIQVNSEKIMRGELTDTVPSGNEIKLSFDGMSSLFYTEKIKYRYDTIPVYILVGYDDCPDGITCGSGLTIHYTFTWKAYAVYKKRKNNNETCIFEYIPNPVSILSYDKKERLDNDPHYIIWSTQPRKLSK